MPEIMLKLLNSLLPKYSPEQRQALLADMPSLTTVQFDKGDTIYHRGSHVHKVFILVSGLVRVFDIEDHHEVNLRFLCDSSVVMPFYAAIDHWHLETDCIATETAQCITRCSGYWLPLSYLSGASTWGAAIQLELALRHYKSMEERLRMIQLKTAAQRYDCFVRTMPSQIVEHMPSVQVASYLGITPETLSRVRHQVASRPSTI